MYAISCSNSMYDSISFHSHNMVFIKFKNITVTLGNAKLLNSGNIIALIWSQSNFDDICFLNLTLEAAGYLSLQLIDASFNVIQVLKSYCLFGSKNIKILLLSNNALSVLQPHTFAGLDKLFKLDLSHNNLVELSHKILINSEIEILDIRKNSFRSIDPQISLHLKVDLIFTDDYKLCCLMVATDTICLTKPKWPESCKVMLDRMSAKIVAIFEFIMIIILNSVSIICQTKNLICRNTKYNSNVQKKKRQNVIFLINILSINTNDILFGIYLCAIFMVDLHYGTTYVVYVNQWLSHGFCKALGFISTFSLLNSLLFLNLVAVSRFYIVKYPFSYHFKTIKVMARYLVTIVLCNIMFCALILFSYQTIETNSLMSSSACLFLGETFKSVTVKIATILIIILQTGSFVSITIFSIEMWNELKKSTVSSSNTNSADKEVLKQSVLVTVTNALCWLPSSAIYIASLIMEAYPTNL